MCDMIQLSAPQAAAVFASSFAYRIGAPLGAIGDIPHVRYRQPFHGITDEFFPIFVPPLAADAVGRANASSQQFYLTLIVPLDAPLSAELLSRGYALEVVETLMSRSLGGPTMPSPAVAPQPITDADQLDALLVDGRSAFRPEHVGDLRWDIRAIYADGAPVSWGAQIFADDDYPYVTNVHTVEAHRRKGHASAVMVALLAAAQRRGARQSVLTASADGRSVYRVLGYRDLAHIHVWRSSAPLERP